MPLGHAEFAAIRKKLGLTQAQLAELLGVHPMTVSRWERGALVPGSWHVEMLLALRQAGAKNPQIGRETATALARGPLVALLVVLRSALA